MADRSFGLSRALLVGAALVLVATPVAEATNGIKLTAYGARAAGRGGVDYAFSDDAVGTNPAGMAFIYGNRFDQNWAVILPEVSWTNQFGTFDDRDVPFVPVPAFSFGVSLDPSKEWELKNLFDMGRWGLVDEKENDGGGSDGAPLGELTEEEEYGSKLRIGFGVIPVTGGKVQLKDMRVPLHANEFDWEVDSLMLSLTPSIAYRITRFFSVGLQLQLQYGWLEIDGGIAQPASVLSDDFEFANNLLNVNPQIITIADIDDTNAENGQFGFSFRLGAMFTSKYLTVGLIYQDRTYGTDFLGRSTVDSTDEINNLTMGNAALLQIIDPRINPALGFASTYDIRIQDFAFPRYVGLGIAVRPHPRISLGLDYSYIHWSETFKTFKARLSNGSNPNIDILTGSSISVRVPLDMENQHVIAFGVSGLVYQGKDIVEGVPSWALVLRAGYNYASNPTPGDTVLPQQPAITEHHISAGFTVHVGPLLEVNFAWEWALPNTLDTGPLHQGNFLLSNSEQEVDIMFFHFGLGANF